MKTIYNYIDAYGHLSFEELPFNEVDNLVFSILSYLDFDGIIEMMETIKLKDAAKIFFAKYDTKMLKNNILAVRKAIKVLDKIKTTHRYEDLKLYNYVYKCNHEKQFSALFIDIDEQLTYVSFEGTDDKLSGWVEDGALSYEFPVPAHKEAIKYINHNISIFTRRRYILGGHSKGGNLALVAGMYANSLIKKKIVKIYSNDGPGLRLREMESHKYKMIEDKYELIVPEYSVVGLLLRHKENMTVVASNKIGLMAHDATSWEIDGSSLKKTKLSKFSKRVDKIIKRWLDNYNDVERKEFVRDIAEIFEEARITSLLDIKAATLTSLISIVKSSAKLDKKSRDIILEFINTVYLSLKEEGIGSLFK